jgi:hypothetical protein
MHIWDSYHTQPHINSYFLRAEGQVDFSSGPIMNGLTAPVTELIFSMYYA